MSRNKGSPRFFCIIIALMIIPWGFPAMASPPAAEFNDFISTIQGQAFMTGQQTPAAPKNMFVIEMIVTIVNPMDHQTFIRAHQDAWNNLAAQSGAPIFYAANCPMTRADMAKMVAELLLANTEARMPAANDNNCYGSIFGKVALYTTCDANPFGANSPVLQSAIARARAQPQAFAAFAVFLVDNSSRAEKVMMTQGNRFPITALAGGIHYHLRL